MNYEMFLDNNYDEEEETGGETDELDLVVKVLSQMYGGPGKNYKSMGFKKVAFNDEFFWRADA